jgi:signal transduction histidine kinase
MVEQSIKDVELTAKDKGIYLKYIKPKRKIPIMMGDPEKIKHSFMNILNNAVLYTPKGGVTVKLNKKDDKILIEIKDTGVGIDKDDQEKIFLSFSRGKDGAALYTQGTGLGLYVAKSFVEMHNGRLWCESDGKGKGSTFFIELPIISKIISKQDFNLPSSKNKEVEDNQ